MMNGWYGKYDDICPSCKAGVIMVNTSWAECVNPYCKDPYSVNYVWVRDRFE